MSPPTAWRCLVCGYVHRAPNPPEVCPVCGAPGRDFEPFSEATALPPDAPPPAAAQQFRCLNCQHVHRGAAPPTACPVCGAPADRFEPTQPEAPAGATGQVRTVVVLGAGVAGVSAAEAVREAALEARIVLISKEHALPYFRLNLTRYLAGEIRADELPLHPESWYREQRIELRRGAEARAIDLARRAVVLQDGEVVPYERLVLADGAHPFVPPIPGAGREGVLVLRSLADADRLLGATAGSQVVCIGGGVLGLETAAALKRRSHAVTVVEGFPWLLPRQLPEPAARMLERHLRGLGIDLRLGAQVEEIAGDERVHAVALRGGEVLPADLVVVTAGVRPNSYLARRAGLRVGQGVIVDDRLVCSHPDVLAAGDVAEHRGALYGTWAPALYQGRIAGWNATGAGTLFGGLSRSNSLKVLEIPLFSIGAFEAEDGASLVLEEERDSTYVRLVARDGVLRGAVLLGDAAPAAQLKRAIEERLDLSGVLAREPAAGELLAYIAG